MFFLHDPSPDDLATLARTETFRRFLDSGRIGKIGISSNDPAVIESALAGGITEMIQCPANLKVAGHFLETWERCREAGVTIVANHVLGRVTSASQS